METKFNWGKHIEADIGNVDKDNLKVAQKKVGNVSLPDEMHMLTRYWWSDMKISASGDIQKGGYVTVQIIVCMGELRKRDNC